MRRRARAMKRSSRETYDLLADQIYEGVKDRSLPDASKL